MQVDLWVLLAVLALVAVVVVSVFLAMLLWQLRTTLRRVDNLIGDARGDLLPLLANLREISERVKIATVELEAGIGRVEVLLEALGEVGESIRTVNDFLRDGASRYVGRALALWLGVKAAGRAIFRQKQAEEGE